MAKKSAKGPAKAGPAKAGRGIPPWAQEAVSDWASIGAQDADVVERICRLVTAPEAVRVWTSLQRHFPKYAAARKGELGPERFLQYPPTLREMAGDLIIYCEDALDFDRPERKLTRKDRKEIADRVERLTRRLIKELKRASINNHRSYLSNISHHAQLRVWKETDESVDLMMRHGGEFVQKIDRASLLSAKVETLRSVMCRFPYYLELFAESAKVWAREEMVTPHPNDHTAPGLFFIRTMSDYFRRRYGTPLNGVVAALAGIFDVGFFDKSDVTSRTRDRKRGARRVAI